MGGGGWECMGHFLGGWVELGEKMFCVGGGGWGLVGVIGGEWIV